MEEEKQQHEKFCKYERKKFFYLVAKKMYRQHLPGTMHPFKRSRVQCGNPTLPDHSPPTTTIFIIHKLHVGQSEML